MQPMPVASLDKCRAAPNKTGGTKNMKYHSFSTSDVVSISTVCEDETVKQITPAKYGVEITIE